MLKTDGTYYVFGSHLAAARTDDLMSWTQVAGDGVNAQNPLFDDVVTEDGGQRDGPDRVLDGYDVAYVPDAVVLAEMPTTLEQATSQNERWERGRIDLVDNDLGVQGDWYAFSDGVTSEDTGNPYVDGAYCVSGTAPGDEDHAARAFFL